MDGRLVPWDEATLHVLSHGLHYASCVFEGERVYGGRVFRLREHTERLLASAAVMGIPMSYSLDDLCRTTEEVVLARGVREGYVRPLAWRGHEELGISGGHASTHVAIAVLEGDDGLPPELRAAGISLRTSSWVKPGPAMAPVGAKTSANYALAGLAMQEAKAAGFGDALMLDHRGCIAETSVANIFIVKDGVLSTPTTECALDGITRRTVIELARARGIASVVRRCLPTEARAADEAFLTGTVYEVLPVCRIDDARFAVPGPLTSVLLDDYRRKVGKPVVESMVAQAFQKHPNDL